MDVVEGWQCVVLTRKKKECEQTKEGLEEKEFQRQKRCQEEKTLTK